MFRKLSKHAAGLALGLAVCGWSVADAAQPVVRKVAAGGTVRSAPRKAELAPRKAELVPLVAEPAEPAEMDEDVQDLDAVEDAAEGELDTPQVELIQERYPNGNIRVQRYVTQDAEGNYVNHGPFVQYSQAGKKMGAGEFYLGRHHGTWVRWYDAAEGALFNTTAHKQFQAPFIAEVQLHDGDLHGTWSVYDARRLKVSVWHFEHGKREGKSTWFFPNGQRAKEVDYRDGLIDGKSLTWNMKDQLTEDVTFIAGRRLAKTTFWHGPGVKRAEGDTLFAKQPIEARYDWWSANIVYANATDAGVDEKTGLWTWWFPNGQKFCEGRFNHNMSDGKWVYWHNNGQKQTEGVYAQAKQVGRWSTWAEDGKLLSVKDRDEEQQSQTEESEVFSNEELEEAPHVTADGETEEESETRIGRLRVPEFR